MIGLLAAALAWADPVALRAPSGRVVASVGLPDASVGVWLRPELGLSVDYHPAGAVGAPIGWRRDVVRGPRGLGVELGVAGGPMLPWLAPGLVVAVSPTVQVGWAGGAVNAELGVVAPAAIRVAPGFDARVPVLGELWLGGRVGPVRLGGHLGAGSVWNVGSPGELGWGLGLDVGIGAPPEPPAVTAAQRRSD